MPAEYIIAIGVSAEQLPAHGRRTIEWDIEPVVGTSLDNVRRTRDVLEHRVRALVGDILADPPTGAQPFSGGCR